MRTTYVCAACGRSYNTRHGGTSTLCPAHYAKERRARIATRTIAVDFTAEDHQAIADESKGDVADWIRDVVKAELYHRAAIKRLGLRPGETPSDLGFTRGR